MKKVFMMLCSCTQSTAFVDSFFNFQNVTKLGWLGLHVVLVEWRSTTMTGGEQCVMISGASSTLTWCVER